ncbi:hypothetical protein [Patiriisocius marinus]|uniref:hypothetical protein n=1 Tax=Patiriisocius marinus TaxID=1397112 RepID=UPI00232F5DED|nr:hypothetical protein [Patiriisocius marinus]
MKHIIILIVFLTNLIFSQSMEVENEFRKVSGIVKGYDIPKDGILVSYVGLKRAVITDSYGIFCLTVPKNNSVFIEIPICGALTIREIKTTDNNVIIDISEIEKSTKQILRSKQNWNKEKNKLLPILINIYNSTEYDRANNEYCF